SLPSGRPERPDPLGRPDGKLRETRERRCRIDRPFPGFRCAQSIRARSYPGHTSLPASARLLPMQHRTTKIIHKQGSTEPGEKMCVAGCEATVRAALSRRRFFTGAAASGFAVAAAPANATQTRSFTRAVDMTHTMSADFPTFMGRPGIEMQREF